MNFDHLTAEQAVKIFDMLLDLLVTCLAMRVAQKLYFKTRTQHDLVQCKVLEHQLDDKVAIAKGYLKEIGIERPA